MPMTEELGHVPKQVHKLPRFEHQLNDAGVETIAAALPSSSVDARLENVVAFSDALAKAQRMPSHRPYDRQGASDPKPTFGLGYLDWDDRSGLRDRPMRLTSVTQRFHEHIDCRSQSFTGPQESKPVG